MVTKSEFFDTYQNFIRESGIFHTLKKDNAKSEKSNKIKTIHRDLVIKNEFTELHQPQQNFAELNVVKYLKTHAQLLIDKTSAPNNFWFLAQKYVANVHNCCANLSKDNKIPN